MKILLTATLMVALATSFRPGEVKASGSIGAMASNFHLENVLESQPDFFSLEEHRGSVVVLAFFTYH